MSIKRHLLTKFNNICLQPLGLRLQRNNTAALQWEYDRTLGRDLQRELVDFVGKEKPVILDVGANQGQSIKAFLAIWPESTITSFEPDPTSADQMRRRWGRLPGIEIVEMAVLSSTSTAELYRFNSSELNSVFDRQEQSWIREEAIGRVTVPCVSLDEYCYSNTIDLIDLLKVDVQGAELQVILGAKRLLENHLIRLVQLELTFCDLYQGGCRPHEVFAKMETMGYRFIAIYNQIIENGRLQWADGLWRSESSFT